MQFLPIAKPFDCFDLQLGMANHDSYIIFSPSPHHPLILSTCIALGDAIDSHTKGICIPEQMCVHVCSQRKHSQPLSHLQRVFILLHQRVLGQLHLLQLLDQRDIHCLVLRYTALILPSWNGLCFSPDCVQRPKPFFIYFYFAVDLQLINSFAVRPSNFYCSPTDRRNIGSCCTNYQTRCNSCSPDSRGTPFSINPTGNSGSPCFQSAIGCPINYMVATTPGPTAGQNCYFCFGASFSPSFSLSLIFV